MSGKIFIERVTDDTVNHTVREEIPDLGSLMWIIFELDDGQEIRFQNDLTSVYVNGSDPLDIRPESGNVVKIKASRGGY